MLVPALIGGLGPWELLIVLVLVLIVFGAGRLPQVFEQFGKGIRAFRQAQEGEDEDAIEVSKTNREISDSGESHVSEAEEVKSGTVAG